MDSRHGWVNVIWNYFTGKIWKRKARPRKGEKSVTFPDVSHLDSSRMAERIRGYFAKLGPSIDGLGGSAKTFSAACFLVEGLGLSTSEALPWLREYSATCHPPWSEEELQHKLDDADQVAADRGHLLRSGVEWKPARRPDESDVIQADCMFGGTWVSLSAVDHLVSAIEKSAVASAVSWEKLIANRPEPPAEAQEDHPPEAHRHRREMCPNPVKILQAGIAVKDLRVLVSPCQKWGCRPCRGCRIDHISDSIRAHVDQYCRDFPELPPRPLWLGVVLAGDMERVKRLIRRRRGNYAQLAIHAAGRDQGFAQLVISTLPVPGQKLSPGDPHEKAEAWIARLAEISESARCRVFSSSRRWKLLKDHNDKEPEFTNLGRIFSTPEQISNVLSAHGIHTRDFDVPSRWWPAWAWQWAMTGVDHDHLVADLVAGKYSNPISDQDVADCFTDHPRPATEVTPDQLPRVWWGGVLV